MTLATNRTPFRDSRTRRAIDIAVALPALIVASPLVALACLAILLTDGRPVIHKRRVLGKDGQEFFAFKLRTMRVEADEWLGSDPELLKRYRIHTKLENDPRVTPIGRLLRRLYLDELPQFFNVLMGQMSIVGPRMIHPSELPKFGAFGQIRLSVRPGITGLWQVTKTSYDYDQRVALDEYYLANRSLAMDLRIALQTIPSVFGFRMRTPPTQSDLTDANRS